MSPRLAAMTAGLVTVVAVVAAAVALSVAHRPGSVANLLGNAGRPSLVAAADAPVAPALAGVTAFDNTAPLTMQALRGKVVLVDFWTYTCINCRRTFGFLRALQQRYGPAGFTVLGIHSPEFSFEKIHSNVAHAVQALAVTWPVAEDPEMATWKAWNNQYWPADYLVDAAGRVRFSAFGEGNDAPLETAVRALLTEAHAAVPPTSVGEVPATERPGAGSVGLTPETYFGADRGGAYLANGAVVPVGATVTRADPQQPRDVVALHGRFLGAAEGLLPLGGASVTQDLFARDVYLTAASGGSPVVADVTLDGQPVPAARRGPSLRESAGRTVVDIGRDDLYHLLTGPSVAGGVLRLTFASAGARLYTFTYGA